MDGGDRRTDGPRLVLGSEWTKALDEGKSSSVTVGSFMVWNSVALAKDALCWVIFWDFRGLYYPNLANMLGILMMHSGNPDLPASMNGSQKVLNSSYGGW